MASIGTINMRDAMAKQTMTISVKTIHGKEMVNRARIGIFLLKIVARIMGVKMIEYNLC